MWFATALRLIAEGLGIISKRQELNNSPEMQEAAKRKAEQKALDNRVRAVSEKDLEKTRREIGDN